MAATRRGRRALQPEEKQKRSSKSSGRMVLFPIKEKGDLANGNLQQPFPTSAFSSKCVYVLACVRACVRVHCIRIFCLLPLKFSVVQSNRL